MGGLLIHLVNLMFLFVMFNALIFLIVVLRVIWLILIFDVMAQNNPLNIRYSGFNHWLGQCGESKGFCVFESLDYGLRAGLVLLCRTYRWKGYINIRQILGRFAPSSENDTDNYIEFVSCKTGIPRERFLSTMQEYAHVLSAMCYFESAFIVSSHEILRVAREYGIQLKKLR